MTVQAPIPNELLGTVTIFAGIGTVTVHALMSTERLGQSLFFAGTLMDRAAYSF